HAARMIESRIDGGAAIAAEARRAESRDGGDGAVGSYLAHDVIEGVGNVGIAGEIDGDSLGLIHAGDTRGQVIAEVAGVAIAGEGEDIPAGIDAAHARVA